MANSGHNRLTPHNSTSLLRLHHGCILSMSLLGECIIQPYLHGLLIYLVYTMHVAGGTYALIWYNITSVT